MASARVAAARLLLAIERGRTTLGAELEHARVGLASREDRGLLFELAAGTLRWRAELDALIAHASGRPVARLQVEERTVLRLGAYQLFHLPRIPTRAVVHESVEVVRALGASRAAGLVNAVLRALSRLDPTSVLPPRPLDASRPAQLAYLAITLSHPAWIVERWLHRFGFEATERWCQFNNAAPGIAVRSLGVMDAKALLQSIRAAGLEADAAPYVHDAIRLGPGTLGRMTRALRDAVVVQAEGAQIVARAADVRPGEVVLDVCAAPGGKTLVLAADLALAHDRRSRLIAGDFRPQRVALLGQTLRRAGVTAPVVAHDATRPLPYRPIFDCVVLDAPCSGLGTLSRDPDLKWSRTESELPRFAAVEHAMLDEAARLVKPGGRLLYATCSSEPDENQEVVTRFLERTPQFAPSPLSPESTFGGMVDAQGFLATRPDRDGIDAFFAAMLVRRPAA